MRKPVYRAECVLGDLAETPLDYARKLGRTWSGRTLPLRSLAVHASPAGHVRVTVELRSKNIMTAATESAEMVFDAIRSECLGYPAYVMATIAIA
jgi:hypothetical protein